MKEININIEGYNVNGICVGCLSYNRRMFYHDDVKECFRLLGNIDVPDGLQIQVCWECLAYVRNTMRFKQQMLKSYDFLIRYSNEHTFLDSPNDFTPYASCRVAIGDHTSWSCDPNTVKDDETESNEAKDEISDVKEENYGESDTKYDFEIPIKEESVEDDLHFEDLPSLDMSSDEDIQLSKLKDKRETKGRAKRKRKKVDKLMKIGPSNTDLETKVKVKEGKKGQEGKLKSRKLKNLPENLVELYTMTEEEMLSIRAQDVESKEFQKSKYKCDTCIMSFNTEKLMQDHMNGKHQPKSDDCQQCDVCRAYLVTRDNWRAHRSLHLGAYRCVRCGFRSALKCRMTSHVALHAPPAPPHACPTCGNTYNSKSKLNYHRTVCEQEKPQCDCCGKVFANKMTLKYHLKVVVQNKEEKPKEKLYIPCKGCDKVFHSKKSYRAHVVIHDGLTYPCPICGKLFQWKRNLARHTRNHRERDAGALHECRACRKTFASRDCYNNHMRLSKRHVPDTAYQHECAYCGKKFATKWCLTDHIDWEHLKRIKYQCSVCFKAFKTAKIMVAHVNNIHGGKKKEDEGEHLCEICGKSYKTVKRLKGHVWAMHTKRSTNKSYKCKLCPATFTWQTSIYKHMKMMHDTNKKTKQPRTVPPVKKEEPYPGLELGNRMQYFQASNIVGNLNIVHIQPL